MIRGVHTMFYSDQAEALRAFLRDKLGLRKFTDVGDGWLIFDLPEADMGVHPVDSGSAPNGMHAISVQAMRLRRNSRGEGLIDRGSRRRTVRAASRGYRPGEPRRWQIVRCTVLDRARRDPPGCTAMRDSNASVGS